MQLGFGRSYRTVQQRSYFPMVIAFHIVENHDRSVALRQLGKRSLQRYPIENTAWFMRRKVGDLVRHPTGRDIWLFSHVHQRGVYRQAVKPRRERRFGAEGGHFSEQLQEDLLRQILCFGPIVN